MSNPLSSGSWRQKILQALTLLLFVAVGARAAADMLAPLVPVLVALLTLAAIFWFIFRR